MELWNAKRCAERICGVYFLLSGREVVYIGQSVNIFTRVVQHRRKTSWGITGVSYVRCTRTELDDLERRFILCLKPKWNQVRRKPGFFRLPSGRGGSVEVAVDPV